MHEWRAMNRDEQRAAWVQHQARGGAPPAPIPPPQGGPSLGPRERPPRRSPPGEEKPPPGAGLSGSAWNWMSSEQAARISAAHRAGAGGGAGSGGGGTKQSTYTNLKSPPPSSRIPLGEWRAMDPDEQQAVWEEYHRYVETRGNNHDAPPPGWKMTMGEWKALDPEERAANWRAYEKLVRPDEKVVNPDLLEFLALHPELKTVQDMVNAYGAGNRLNQELARLGLDPAAAQRFRFIPLRFFATLPLAGGGRAPDTVEEANRYFLTQNRDPVYNPERVSERITLNCGPTSLVMVLRSWGLIPPGLSEEEEICLVRAWMYPKDKPRKPGEPMGEYVDKQLPGRTLLLLYNERDLTNIDELRDGARQAGLTEAQDYTGWALMDAALRANQSIVLGGHITATWEAQFTGGAGSYPLTKGEPPGHFIAVVGMTSGGDYIVADPMYTGGTVVMSRAQLAEFLKVEDPATHKRVDSEPVFLSPVSLPGAP